MAAFSWLLISDLHLKSEYTTWSQNVVLRDMVRDIQNRLTNVPPVKFIIVSGDLAHSGKAEQYLLVESFLNDLLGILGLNNSDVYIVPGNHDVNRSLRQLAFHGARSKFVDANTVEHYLSNEHERDTLLERLSAYHAFEHRVCPHLGSAYGDDKLAYFVHRLIGDLPIGIVGLNSALACGDDNDKDNIVVGDRPLIEISERIRTADVRLVVAAVHHPPVWLSSFDQKTFEARFLPWCDILHRGHLHEAGVTPIYTSPETKCLVIAAGAGYVQRQFANSYSFISIDVANNDCTVESFAYDTHSGSFVDVGPQKYSVCLRGIVPGNTSELASVIRRLDPVTEFAASYLAALIDGKIAEIPLPMNGAVYFGLLACFTTLTISSTANVRWHY